MIYLIMNIIQYIPSLMRFYKQCFMDKVSTYMVFFCKLVLIDFKSEFQVTDNDCIFRNIPVPGN